MTVDSSATTGPPADSVRATSSDRRYQGSILPVILPIRSFPHDRLGSFGGSFGGILLQQVDRLISQLKKMGMGAISVCHYRKAHLTVSISKKERRVAGHAPAMREVALAVALLHPPGEPKAGGLFPPDPSDGPFEWGIALEKHLLKGLSRQQAPPFKH